VNSGDSANKSDAGSKSAANPAAKETLIAVIFKDRDDFGRFVERFEPQEPGIPVLLSTWVLEDSDGSVEAVFKVSEDRSIVERAISVYRTQRPVKIFDGIPEGVKFLIGPENGVEEPYKLDFRGFLRLLSIIGFTSAAGLRDLSKSSESRNEVPSTSSNRSEQPQKEGAPQKEAANSEQSRGSRDNGSAATDQQVAVQLPKVETIEIPSELVNAVKNRLISEVEPVLKLLPRNVHEKVWKLIESVDYNPKRRSLLVGLCEERVDGLSDVAVAVKKCLEKRREEFRDHYEGVLYLVTKFAEDLFKELAEEEALKPAPKLSELSDEEINKVVEVLHSKVGAYIGEYRKEVCGLLAKVGASALIDPVSVARIIAKLHEAAEAKEPLEQMLAYIPHYYKLRGLWSREAEEKFNEFLLKLGASPGKVYEASVEKPKKPGFRALIYEVLTTLRRVPEDDAQDEAVELVSELYRVLRYRSPVVSVPYSTNSRIMNDPRRGIVIVNVRKTKDGESKSRIYIADWYIHSVTVVEGEGETLYRVIFRNARSGEKRELSGDISEIVAELQRLHGVKRSQRLKDAVSAIVGEFRARGYAKIKRTAAASGIIPTRNGVKLVREGVYPESKLHIPPKSKLDQKKAVEALELLKALRSFYDPYKFDVAMNWGGYASAGYALKRKYGVPQVYMLFYGETGTGKSTLARMIVALFHSNTERPEEAGTEYRLAYVLSVTTTPWLIDDVKYFLGSESLISLIKRAATGYVVRWRGDKRRKYSARASLIFTVNEKVFLEKDAALARRFIALEWSKDESVYSKPREKREEFMKLYNAYLAVAPHLGRVILETVVERWREIEENWSRRIVGLNDYIEFGKQIWRWVAEKLGVEEPPWCRTEIDLEELRIREETELIERIRQFLLDVINEKYRQHVGRVEKREEDQTVMLSSGFEDLRTRISIVLHNKYVPWMYVCTKKFGENRREKCVCLEATALEEMRRRGIHVANLPSLANLLRWLYDPSHPKKLGGEKKTSVPIVYTLYDEFEEFILGEEVEEGGEDKQSK